MGRSIQQTSDGGYIVAGQTQSDDGDVSGYHGEGDAWVVKLNSTGSIEWQKCLGGTSGEGAYCIQQTEEGGYILAGPTTSNDGDVIGNNGSKDFWVVKINNIGSIEWQKCLGGTMDEYPNSIQQTSDGGYIVAGQTQSDDGDVSGNHGDWDMWIVKLNNTGDITWQKCLGGTEHERANNIQQTTDGGYIIAGHALSNDGDVSGNHGETDYWIVKIDDLGDNEWQKCLGGTSYESAESIQQTSDGGYIIVGSTDSDDGDVSGNNGFSDYWVVKINNLGDIEWQKCLGGTGQERARAIQQTTDEGHIIAGYTDSNDGDVNGNNGASDFWVVKLNNTPLIAAFTWNPDPGCVNSPVQFEDLSSSNIEIVSWEWDFGDPLSGIDNYSYLQNPSHLYNDPGDYAVSLIVTNEFSNSDTIIKQIEIYPAVTVQGTVSTNEGELITDGQVLAFKQDNGNLSELVDLVNIQEDGTYAFEDMAPCLEYIFHGYPNPDMYDRIFPRWYIDAFYWFDATPISATDGELLIDDINIIVYDAGPMQSGTSSLSGGVYYYDVKGEPVKNAAVILELIESGEKVNEVVDYTLTDESGLWSFDGLPEGIFKVLVDIPGLNMDSTYTVEINQPYIELTDLDYLVDTLSGIYIGYTAIDEINGLPCGIINVFPNPFTTSTTLSYELQQPEKVSISIYNHLGQLVYQTQENQPQGKQHLIWNAEGCVDGIYYYRLQAGEQIANGKMVKVR